MPVGSGKGLTRANGTHCKSPAHTVFRQLLTAICDLEFVFGLCVLKVILSITNIFRGRRSTSSPLVEMPTWPFRPYASVGVSFQKRMAVSISSGSENEEVADQFSVWITRSQGTRTNAIPPPSSPSRWKRAKTNAADTGIALSYKHLLCVHRQGAVRAWA